jgi:uncharacterized surface protein with fasciclin (FAS1) repeats
MEFVPLATTAKRAQVEASRPNKPPTMNEISDLRIAQDEGQITVDLSGIGAGNGESQRLKVTATSDNPSWTGNLAVKHAASSATGSLTFTPAAGESGQATITVAVTDAGWDNFMGTDDDASVERKFTVTAISDITSTIEGKGQFAKLLEAARTAGVLGELDSPGPFTVFAPTDEAFERLEPGVLDRLMAAPDTLTQVLHYHALTERLSADEALNKSQAKTVLGPDLEFKAEGDRVFVNDAEIIESDVECTNGVLHVIDHVLLPPDFELPEPEAATEPEDDVPPAPAPEEQPAKAT